MNIVATPTLFGVHHFPITPASTTRTIRTRRLRNSRRGAKQQVEAYLLAVKERRKHAATHRYISVETLRPTKKQVEDFTRKQPPLRHVEPARLRCLMVFDTQTREFVGSGCYVVSSEPSAGEVAQFETVSAEFVGHGT